jgi:hypothetical protein
MGYRTGALTSANPAADLYAQIVAEFDLHGNWDFVDTVAIGTNTHQVWKNRGTGTDANAFGQDYHVSFQYVAAGGTTLRIRCFEAYDAVNDKAIRPCVGASTSLAINANGSHGDETLGFTLEATALVYADVLTVTTGFDYYVQVSRNRLCVGTKYSTTNTALYAGLFESLMAADPFPLCIGGTSGNENASTVDFGVSRHPNKTTTEINNFLFHMSAWTAISGHAEQNDLFHNAAVASRPFLRHLSNAPAQYGYARGLLYGCALLPDGGTATVNGSTMTIGAETYTKLRFGTYGYSPGAWVRQAEL